MENMWSNKASMANIMMSNIEICNNEMLKVERGTRDNQIFFRGIGGLAPTPSPRCDTHEELCHLPNHQEMGAL